MSAKELIESVAAGESPRKVLGQVPEAEKSFGLKKEIETSLENIEEGLGDLEALIDDFKDELGRADHQAATKAFNLLDKVYHKTKRVFERFK